MLPVHGRTRLAQEFRIFQSEMLFTAVPVSQQCVEERTEVDKNSICKWNFFCIYFLP